MIYIKPLNPIAIHAVLMENKRSIVSINVNKGRAGAMQGPPTWAGGEDVSEAGIDKTNVVPPHNKCPGLLINLA